MSQESNRSERRARSALVVELLARCACVGLVIGFAFGLGQAIYFGLPHRAFMGPRQWADVLSYAAVSHALLWAMVASVLGLALAAAAAASERVRSALRPGLCALVATSASIAVFVLWTFVAYSGLGLAQGIALPWLAAMAALFVTVATTLYVAARPLVDSAIGHAAAAAGRLALVPVVALSLASLVLQYIERPRLYEPTTDWKSAARDDTAPGPPSVVLLVIDTQRADRFGAYGYPRATTPRIDAFAADALLFENATSAAIWTLASHASMFTGLHPSEHGADNHHLWLDDDFNTLAELLRERGYETAAFSNNTWVAPVSNLTQGFDLTMRPGDLHHARGTLLSKFLDTVLYPAGRVPPWLGALATEDQGARYTPPLVERWLERRDASRPFFLFVNISDPHGPFRPAPPYRELFVAPEDVELSYRSNWDRAKPFSLLKRKVYSERELKVMNDAYDAETRLVDDHIGELLEALGRNVSLDEVLVVLTADHGENLGDHHLQGHAHCVYETLVHVPLIVRFPKRVSPGRSSEVVQTIDIFPTVLDAVGAADAGKGLRGRSLLRAATGVASTPARGYADGPNVEGAAVEAGIAVAERVSPNASTIATSDVRFDQMPFMGVLRSIRKGPWKYIIAANGREELYHLEDDPGETVNRIENERAIAADLAQELARWIDQSRPYAGSETLEGEQRMDDATKSQLRALGYLQ
jgi:arylsulfatase A-like enzyme